MEIRPWRNRHIDGGGCRGGLAHTAATTVTPTDEPVGPTPAHGEVGFVGCGEELGVRARTPGPGVPLPAVVI
jgi:hypothetical protein